MLHFVGVICLQPDYSASLFAVSSHSCHGLLLSWLDKQLPSPQHNSPFWWHLSGSAVYSPLLPEPRQQATEVFVISVDSMSEFWRNDGYPCNCGSALWSSGSAMAALWGWKGVAPLASRAKHNSLRGLLMDLDFKFHMGVDEHLCKWCLGQ